MCIAALSLGEELPPELDEDALADDCEPPLVADAEAAAEEDPPEPESVDTFLLPHVTDKQPC